MEAFGPATGSARAVLAKHSRLGRLVEVRLAERIGVSFLLALPLLLLATGEAAARGGSKNGWTAWLLIGCLALLAPLLIKKAFRAVGFTVLCLLVAGCLYQAFR